MARGTTAAIWEGGMQRIVFALALGLGACSQPPAGKAPEQPQTTQERPLEDRQIITAMVNAALAADFEKDVSARIDTLRAEGDWAWVVALPQAPDGGAFDFRGTRYAERQAAGMLDGGGTTYMLLQRQEGVWVVRDFAVGPTDLAYADWPTQYGAPAALMGLPAQ